MNYIIPMGKKVIIYDVLDIGTGEWEDAITLDEMEKERLSFSECYEYYTAERDIARKLFTELLIKSQNEMIKKIKK